MVSRVLRTTNYVVPGYLTCTRRQLSSRHPECKERSRNPFYDPYYEESVWSHKPRCYSGGKNLVTLAPGVGNGPELMEIVKQVCVVANAPVIFEEIPMGEDADDNEMNNLIYSIERNGVAIKGNIEPSWTSNQPVSYTEIPRSMDLRISLDLYVNLIEIRSFPGLINKTRLKKSMDVVLVRQNTEGEFSMLEHEIVKGIEHLKITTKYNSQRLAEFALNYASEHKKTKVTVIYNKELMQKSEGLFLNSVIEMADKYPDIKLRFYSLHDFITNLSTLTFTGEVIVAGALYGGMIASLLFGLTNGTGIFCGQNLGPRYAVFEPAARNKGYKLVGKDSANPVAALGCAINMLNYLGHTKVADRIERALKLTLNQDEIHTADLLGTASCSQVVDNVVQRIREVMPEGYDKPPPHIDSYKNIN